MAVLPKYNNLEEKGGAFHQTIISNKTEVDQLLIPAFKEDFEKEKTKKHDLIYRGVTNAKYKLFSSAQRAFIEKELDKITTFDALITGEIQKALEYQNGVLRKYLEGFNIPFDLPVLSFLQHYGAPTPLIDWTYNIEIAMFFSTDGLKHDASNTDIDNYFSIYSIDKGQCFDLQNISKWLATQLGNLYYLIEEHPEADATEVLENYRTFNYHRLSEVRLFYVSDFERYMNFPALTTQSNLNIINQEGLFIFNSSPNEPLEAFFGTTRDPYHLPRIRTFDIHKSLFYYVQDRITEARRDLGLIPINKEFIYPQEEDIAKKAFINYLKN